MTWNVKGNSRVGQFLHQFLVLVQLLQCFNVHARDVLRFRLITVLGVTKNAHLHTGAGDVGKLDGSAETFVSLGVVVLQGDLEFHSFNKLALFFSSMCKHCLHILLVRLAGNLPVICTQSNQVTYGSRGNYKQHCPCTGMLTYDMVAL